MPRHTCGAPGDFVSSWAGRGTVYVKVTWHCGPSYKHCRYRFPFLRRAQWLCIQMHPTGLVEFVKHCSYRKHTYLTRSSQGFPTARKLTTCESDNDQQHGIEHDDVDRMQNCTETWTARKITDTTPDTRHVQRPLSLTMNCWRSSNLSKRPRIKCWTTTKSIPGKMIARKRPGSRCEADLALRTARALPPPFLLW